MPDLILDQQGVYQSQLDSGLRLAETPESEGGWQEYFMETDEADLRIDDPILLANTALLLENCKRWMAQQIGARPNRDGQFIITEATRAAAVGGFTDYMFPIIRAAFPTNPINDLVSVQPTTRPTALMTFWNWVRGRTKGNQVKGERVFDAQVGARGTAFNYTSELVPNEVATALSGADATYTYTLKWAAKTSGVRPGTVHLTIDCSASGGENSVFVDDGNGEFISSDRTVASSSIDYETGEISIMISGDTFSTNAGAVSYRINSELADWGPEIDVQLTTSSVDTERHWVMLNWSRESMQNLMAEYGMSLEPQLISGGTEMLNRDIARRVIFELWRVASAVSTFSASVPSGAAYSKTQHYRDLMITLNQVSNTIYKRTQKGYGNWLIADDGASNIIQSLPKDLFAAAPPRDSVQGLHFIGTLGGRYRVYKDIFLEDLSGASAAGNILMGHKGSQFYDAMAVYSPFHQLYATDTNEEANFKSSKGLASRFAFKMVNPDGFARINITA